MDAGQLDLGSSLYSDVGRAYDKGMAEFASLDSYYAFEKSVRWKARFVHDEQTQDFLKVVLETSTLRLRTIPKGQILFRAQRGFTWRTERRGEEDEFEVETALGPERMVPKAALVGDGRVNPSKIPSLYLASNRNTAMAEVRPWVGSRISLAEFKLMRDCVVVDCSADQKRSWQFQIIDLNARVQPREPSAADKEAGVWGDIAYAFSEPVDVDDPNSDYLPTQILAETFRGRKYDGIVYKSLLDERGKNIALFDVSSAELISRCLFEAKTLRFEFDQVENPYFVARHYPELARSAAQEGA
jgi:hypothetical protein